MKSFERFRPGLEKALALSGTHSIDDVVERVSSGKARVWVNENAIIFTEVRQYPQKKVLRLWLGTGELQQIMKLHREILEWGRQQGCESATIIGRRGWTKVLKSEGWTETMSVLEQEL